MNMVYKFLTYIAIYDLFTKAVSYSNKKYERLKTLIQTKV